jgi:mitogen-activated protein kinase 15
VTPLYVSLFSFLCSQQDVHKKYLVYQLLKAVKYMHSADLIHRDIKPSNLLCNRDCHLRLCDFGMTRSLAMPEGPSPNLTDYTTTRWYRSPEVLLGSVKYGKEVDIWSIGCVLAELFLHRPLFPGRTTMHQVELILQVSSTILFPFTQVYK